MLSKLLAFFLLVTSYLSLVTPSNAVVDPLSVPNNKYGIHIISPTPDEASPAATLVNSSGGDWGYITILVESKDRNTSKWQQFFNELRTRHLIPIVRLATEPQGEIWKKPYPGEEEAWAGFLDNLIWPTKNRYIVVYNEPNQAHEWGGQIDAADYARTLDKTITALKSKSDDFFVMNGGFDASAPNQPPNYLDELTFLKQMDQAVPGIFNKLDGWVSHSYPNPGFTGSPTDSGQGSVRTWFWEIQNLRSLGVKKDLPVFITETGWKHSEGLKPDLALPSAEQVADYFETSFKNAWNSSRIVAVTPFVLTYQDTPFDHFSFKKLTGEKQNFKILGAKYPEYYEPYEKIASLPKISGAPVQENKAILIKGEIYKSLVAEQDYTIPLTFKNTGQSIWNDRGQVRLVALDGARELNISPAEIPTTIKIPPGQDYTFNLKLKAPEQGIYSVSLLLEAGDQPFSGVPWQFVTEIKAPVLLKIKAKLKWKKNYSGDYILSVKGANGDTERTISLSDAGLSKELEARYLLPGYKFEFSLSRPYYQPVLIERPVSSGLNTFDFGTLEPDFGSALLNPPQIWQLLPFSN